MSRTRSRTLVVGVDTGGTFTDIVFRDGAERGVLKVLSTPEDPATAVLEGLERAFAGRRPHLLTYGTTVATNAMLERRGVATALVTTVGFEDVLEIGRQARPDLYALEPQTRVPLVGRTRRYGVSERSLYDGRVLARPRRSELAVLRRRLARAGVESVAVCLLHAASNAENELRVERALSSLGVPVSVSHRLSPAPGEFERTATTVANAYVRPILEKHVLRLASGSGARRFRVMQSNGGGIGSEIAAREPIRTMLSGPAGGVVAARERAREAGIERAVSFDMGGTSTDVALIAGELPRRNTTVVGGVPVRTPCVDIHTVGAGGGSIAELDPGGSLKVGPKSAGADPGPACYGRGGLPTVTDAHLLLGRLRARAFLGGDMLLDAARAERSLRPLARRMRVKPAQAAAGVIEVVEGNMERAVRLITVERGEDPRDCTLICFGGAAGLHACGLADKLGMRAALIPRDPGLLSAHGVLEGPVVRDRSAYLRLADPSFAELSRAAEPMVASGVTELAREGIPRSRVSTQAWLKLRYQGQSIELEVPLTRSFRQDFLRLHRRRFHRADESRALECTGLRVSVAGASVDDPTSERRLPARRRPGGRPRPWERAEVFLHGRFHRIPVYRREQLPAGFEGRGPAVVVEYSSTVFVDRGWAFAVDRLGNLRLERRSGSKT